jgi:ABC-type sugar transport system ATPase subunit
MMTTQTTTPTETTVAATDIQPSPGSASGQEVRCRKLNKSFARHESPALDDIDITVAPGSITVLLGPSGCGKTTLLRCISGLETPTSGQIHIAGRNVTTVAAEDRGVAMVFQNYALYPNKSVRGNLEFPLRMAGIDRATRKRQATETGSTANPLSCPGVSASE